ARALVRLLAPILCFTTEEVWSHLPADSQTPESVHLALFPAAEEVDPGLAHAQRNQWEKLFSVRAEVLKALERARQAKTIRASLEAKVYLRADGELADLLEKYHDELASLFIVSHGQVELSPAARRETQPTDLPGLAIAVAPAEGKKCERCWNYSPSVGMNPAHPTLCERCTRALAEFEAA
ncbi:MAG: class I tRNA ligase family protein, partial [Terriglobia bacterium]